MERMRMEDNQSNNQLILHDTFIELNGFDKVQDVATFCFYPSNKVVIMSKHPDSPQDFHYVADVVEGIKLEKRIFDEELIALLKNSGMKTKTDFLNYKTAYHVVH